MSKTEDGDGFPKQLSTRSRIASVLSTKKLTTGQRELLLNRGIGLVEMDFISIAPINFEIKNIPDNLIFTSKNSVRAILKHPLRNQLQGKNIFCVGEKTAVFLKQNGFRVSKMANYGGNLASEIINNQKKEEFLFFCGKKRNADLPERLKSAGVNFSEVEVYDTHEVSKKIDRTFDGVLFFSPSAVRSYCSQNDLKDSLAFCIGTTTAAEARKFTNEIVIATTPSIENVIVQVVKKFT
ncbi:uroporphyrinogen-III synthase [Salinimicrobium sp. TH3]|uniref:uroporphyrinogen-III synthase n=1 Tax=Salinimicrobium sp. TH3 TaxID=2997342 RepID=UPI002273C05D|nr:uroporphyrinogen-III synthase [Salinimicrobium sp. TH3]MCY2686618.1 uroporphyrinogen-III synthase [Salinimicrobium sp. TH3]